MSDEFTPIVAIYGLIDPRTGCIRYVGKTTNIQRRYKQHVQDNSKRACHRTRWIRALRRAGLCPELVPLQFVEASRWKAAEQWWIAHFREHGADLTNETGGGEGLNDISDELRARLSVARKGKRLPDIAYERARAASIGRRKSVEELERLRAAHRTPEYRAKLSAALTGLPKSESHKAAMSVARKEMFRSNPSMQHGEDNGSSKLSLAEAKQIALDRMSGMRQQDIANKYGVSSSQISRILSGEQWRRDGLVVVPRVRVRTDDTMLKWRTARTVKLTEQDVIEIREMIAAGMRLATISNKYGVSKQQISKIGTGKRWRGVGVQSSSGQNSGKMLSNSEKLGIGMSMLTEGSGIGGNGSEGKLQSDMMPHGEMNTEVEATPEEPLDPGTPTTAAVAGVAAAPMSVAPNTSMP